MRSCIEQDLSDGLWSLVLPVRDMLGACAFINPGTIKEERAVGHWCAWPAWTSTEVMEGEQIISH